MSKLLVIRLLLIVPAMASAAVLYSQANVNLSNLVAPTGVNVNLLPNADNIRTLGSATRNWNRIYLSGLIYKGSEPFISAIGMGNTTVGVNASKNALNGDHNTAIGENALLNNTDGFFNTAVGTNAMQNNVVGSVNTAVGVNALSGNINGFGNAAVGNAAMASNSEGNENTAIGITAMYGNRNGQANTAGGYTSLYNNNGNKNVAFGHSSLYANTTGNFNTANGAESIISNSTGSYNTGIGFQALKANLDGQKNTAVGVFGLVKNRGSNNAAIGAQSLFNNTTGSLNTAMGVDALFGTTTQSKNTGVGYQAGLNSVMRGTFVGSNSNSSAGLTNVTAIGFEAVATASNQVRIGNASVTSIGGNVGWTSFSDGRFKSDVNEDVPGLEFIKELRPVTYKLDVVGIKRAAKSVAGANKEENDVDESANTSKREIVYTGLVAQQVEKAAQKLNYEFSGVDAPADDKGFYGLRYSDFVVPLIKAIQELSVKNEGLEEEIRELREIVKRLDGNAGTFNKSSLGQNYPNPFSGSTIVMFDVPVESANAKIVITNLKGQQLQALAVGKGMRQVTINSGTLPSGTYHYSLWVDGEKMQTRKMTIAR